MAKPSSLDLEDNEVDRLSKLPDDVLLNIVERLDIADAARTAILSRRWMQIPAVLSKIWVKPEGRRQLLSVFHKLTLVNLLNISEECDLTWIMFILQGAPTLKELRILVRDHLCEMVAGEQRKKFVFSEEKDKGLEWEPSASDFKHHNLAELRIYGRFQAEDNIVRFLRNVMEAAVNLEDIKLFKCPVCEDCKHMLQEWTLMEKSLLSHKLNFGMLPSNVKIQFPSLGNFFTWSKYRSWAASCSS